MVFEINRTSSTFDSDVIFLLRIGTISFLILKYLKTEPVVLYLIQITTPLVSSLHIQWVLINSASTINR
jgi:hypothetical protein